jgi:DNA mismatch repair ATPase MutS
MTDSSLASADVPFGRRETDLDTIAAYWLTHPTANALNERTWSDLNGDALFALVDSTSCGAGQQLLYEVLREPSRDAAELAQRDAAISAIDAPLRRQLAATLREARDLHGVHRLFGEDLPARPPFAPVVPLLTGLAVLSTIALVVTSAAAIAPFLIVALINFALQIGYRSRIHGFIPAVASLRALLRAAEVLARLEVPALDREVQTLRAAMPRVASLAKSTSWLFLEHASANEMTKMVTMYLNMFLLLDVNAFVSSISIIRRERASLEAVFRAVGLIDAYASAAAFRGRLEIFTRPQFVQADGRAQLQLRGAVHPLLGDPIANDLAIDGHGVLITGSNMSGKTTFLRTVAINALLAQSLCTVAAEEYVAPLLAIRTAIGGGDSLLEGKSYYMKQVEDIRELVRAAERGETSLFIVDELFRGTNTVERIAAGKAILSQLARGSHIVLAATHDLELIELLGERYDVYHFAESLAEGALAFDYKLHHGAASTRNAIALLAASEFPPAVVTEAYETVALLEKRWH